MPLLSFPDGASAFWVVVFSRFGSLRNGFLRLASLAAACIPGAVSLRAAPPVNVVLVHGIYDRGRIFAPLVRVLEARGCRCLAPSLTPNDCRDGVHALATQLSADIDARFGAGAPVVLVGFSMGGLVSRDYVQTLARPGRVRGVLLISPPNHGTLWACLACGGTRDLGLGSRFLARLNGDEHAWRNIPVRTYWTPLDLMIVPATSSLWPVGDTRTILCALHPWMVRNPALMADVAACVAAIGGRSVYKPASGR